MIQQVQVQTTEAVELETVELEEIVGGHTLTKVGTGTLTFATANTYRGQTTVNNGILV